jgi:hypothetical protein
MKIKILFSSWHSALYCASDCQPSKLKFTAVSRRPKLNQRLHAEGSGLWHSALQFNPLSLAFRSIAIWNVAFRGLNAADSHNPQH